jgi:hypothetical protein
MRLNLMLIFGLLLAIGYSEATAQRLDDRRLNLYAPRGKVLPFKVGNEITFQMKDFEHFYTLQITNLRGDSIIFGDGVVRLHQIEAVKYPRRGAGTRRSLAGMLYIFSGSWLFYTGIDDVMGNAPSWSRASVIAGTAGTLGLALQLSTRPKTYYLDDKNFMKIIIP